MTNDDFAFWEKAFLAAMQARLTPFPHHTDPSFDYWRRRMLQDADAALAVWREKRAEVVTTDGPCPFCHAPCGCMCAERQATCQ